MSDSLIASILSAGTFFGVLIAGDVADFIGRRTTVIAGCGIFSVGVALQVASSGYGLLIAGRLIAGLGVGFVSAIIILFMLEIATKKVRGAIPGQLRLSMGLKLIPPPPHIVFSSPSNGSGPSFWVSIPLHVRGANFG